MLADQKDNLVFIDLDGITSRAALSDFFNVICRTQGFELLLKARQIFHKELELAFCAHQIQYTESVYDLYLSKFVEMRLVNAKNGHNDNILYKSMEWIFDPVAEKEFPLTHALGGQFNFELTPKGYRVY